EGDPLMAAISSAGGDGKRAPEILFLGVIRPLMERAVTRLREGLARMVQASEADSQSRPTRAVGAAIGPAVLECALVRLLPARLLPILLRTVVLELNVARVQGPLKGESGEARLDSFSGRVKHSETGVAFFRE